LPEFIVEATGKKAPGVDPVEYIHGLVEREIDPGERVSFI